MRIQVKWPLLNGARYGIRKRNACQGRLRRRCRGKSLTGIPLSDSQQTSHSRISGKPSLSRLNNLLVRAAQRAFIRPSRNWAGLPITIINFKNGDHDGNCGAAWAGSGLPITITIIKNGNHDCNCGAG